ncbi:Phospholipid-transporting ATPase 1 [Striga hermonthica]|uniref:Phospholipid-transporting ATPase 1 n=1 Tax=Striga hermonthica TaxID=68872 RepID=A0A9N7RQH8_STRHE|nr:Phospholipid-transporting ATPase 1 [Striga hermonthica]
MKVSGNESLPCDISLLSTRDPTEVAELQTTNLCGEGDPDEKSRAHDDKKYEVARFMEKVGENRVQFKPGQHSDEWRATWVTLAMDYLYQHLIVQVKNDRDLTWWTRVKLIPVICGKLQRFQNHSRSPRVHIPMAKISNIKVKDLLLNNQ